MSILELIASIVSSLAWPGAVAFIIWKLHPHLEPLMPRLHKIGPQGVELYPQNTQESHNQDDAPIEITDNPLNPLDDLVAARFEKRNLEDAEKLPEENRVKWLIRAITLQELQKMFAIAYANIFGTQIEALQVLNQGPVSIAKAEEMFQRIQAQHEVHRTRSLRDFMLYLENWEFITTSGGDYEITQTGRNFLVFLSQQGLSLNRPF